jgi:hypothetical protein
MLRCLGINHDKTAEICLFLADLFDKETEQKEEAYQFYCRCLNIYEASKGPLS